MQAEPAASGVPARGPSWRNHSSKAPASGRIFLGPSQPPGERSGARQRMEGGRGAGASIGRDWGRGLPLASEPAAPARAGERIHHKDTKSTKEAQRGKERGKGKKRGAIAR